MIEYVNSFLLLTLLGIIYYIYHKYKRFYSAINIVMDSAIINQLNNIEKEANSEVTKSKRGHKKKTDTKGTIMKIRSILTCIMLSLPQYLNCKTFRCIY